MINIDWLSFSVCLAMGDEETAKGARLCCPADCSLVEAGTTNIYRRRVLVLNSQGEKLLTLLLQPYSKVIDPKSMFVEVANKWLYYPLDWVLLMLANIHEYSVQSLSRLDIAYDFTPTVAQVHVIDSLQDTSMYVQGKREGSMFYDYSLPKEGGRQSRNARALSWGSKASNIKWKLYNKTLEIFQLDDKGHKWCTKPYIVDAWKNEGLDVDNVWRLEVSIMAAAKFAWHDEKLDFLLAVDSVKIRSLFHDLYCSRFVIRANQGHKCRKWDDIVPFLDVEGEQFYRVTQICKGVEQISVEHATTLRAAMTQLERPEVLCYRRMRDVWIEAVDKTIKAGKLQPYFYRTYGRPWTVVRNCIEQYNSLFPPTNDE